MAGRAEIRSKDNISIQHFYLFSGDSTIPCLEAINPLNRYSMVRKYMKMQRLSSAFSFAQSMSLTNLNREIGLVMNAREGTKIVDWLPGTKLY
jgi:hypothetical protein